MKDHHDSVDSYNWSLRIRYQHQLIGANSQISLPCSDPRGWVQIPIFTIEACVEAHFDHAYYPASPAKPPIVHSVHTVSYLLKSPKLAEGHLRGITYFTTLNVTSFLNYPSYSLIARRVVYCLVSVFLLICRHTQMRIHHLLDALCWLDICLTSPYY